MKPIITFLFTLSILHEAATQRFDNTWYLGYPGNGAIYGPSKATFDNGSFSIKKDTSFFRGMYDSNNTVISDSNGNFLAAFNGFWIYDKTGKIMLNGDSIWYETLPYLYGYSDDDIPQGGMFLPYPGHPDSILLFYTSQGNAAWPQSVDLACLNLFYAVIQKSGNGGKGVVLEKRLEVINDTIQYGRLSAVKHANGRDWWILINKRNSNCFYRLLFNSNGVLNYEKQYTDLTILDGLGQAAFSPNGSFYAIKNSISEDIGNTIDIFGFDRCHGLLSQQYQIHQEGSGLGGLAFSPNSRFLYVSFRTEVYQYDLYSNNLDSSKVLVGLYEPPPDGFPATFFTMQLAPDNKIYMCATNAIQYLHVIHNPDGYGINCQFQQRGIVLPTKNYSSVSYSPYFRLGPLDNSLCDTLGLDNSPVAWFRYEQDTLNPFNIAFKDLSYYDPTTWSWDFGDNSPGSAEISPVHQFDSAGIYQVCLTVSNDNADNTYCQTLYLGVSNTNNPILHHQCKVSPNPFTDNLVITCGSNFPNSIFRLYDQTGRVVFVEQINQLVTALNIEQLPKGLYLWTLSDRDTKIESGKLIKGADAH